MWVWLVEECGQLIPKLNVAILEFTFLFAVTYMNVGL